MAVQGISTNNIVSEPAVSESSGDDLGKEEFLTLLVAQLQNQDPLNPMESTEFTSQLAQFSNLEQLVDINENTLGIQEVLNSQTKETAIDYLGNTIKADGNIISLKDGDQSLSGSFVLDSKTDVEIFIYDADGTEVRNLEVGWLDSGEHSVEWDGKNSAGAMVPDGAYSFEVYGKDESNNYVSIATYSIGEVTGITQEYDLPYLMVGDKLIAQANVIEVKKTE
ncbi:flagellar basal-body rod modification protein FlgD [Candidatus Magnetomoraceae bacterium gMMP-15]